MTARSQPGDLELLAIQAGMNLDPGGRMAGRWGMEIVAAPEGQRLFLGSELSPQLAAELRALFDAAPGGSDPSVVPPALIACERRLRDIEAGLQGNAGPSYVFPQGTCFSSAVELIDSASQPIDSLRHANPGNWLPDEWDELVDGLLGPWAMARVEGRVVSICHTPRSMTADAAECGVWTDREFRGRGHAAAVTAAWASLLAPTGRHLFYSTTAANLSSQRVAARLALHPIGWTWSLARPQARPGNRHPLSKPGYKRP